ncbi:hypothetical protein ZWY2020_015477 [Hordeum vulgare]|nr:hypothetical protein ZWY2020_015477 [Hordeum vulgare]
METISTGRPVHMVPDDVMADILHRLGPHDLAVSRCVCKPWCAVIDARRMLPADSHLLPLSLAGFFTVFTPGSLTAYFSRPSAPVVGKFDYLDTHDACSLSVVDQCNGLLLTKDHRVINPVTQQWASLPPYPFMFTLCIKGGYQPEDMYLVFDPSVSPHYEVFLFHSVPYTIPDADYYEDVSEAFPPAVKKMEWPPSSYTLRVYSSKTRQWEEKPFIREGEAAGTIGDMEFALSPGHCHAAYWRRALYVHQHDFVIRITLSNDKYKVIKLPLGLDVQPDDEPDHYLGKSEKGVYCALLYGENPLGLRIWFLDETCGQMKWLLKHDINLGNLLADFPWEYGHRSWSTQYVNNAYGKSMARTGENFEPDYSINVSAIFAKYNVSLLGFHPYREILFFCTIFGRAIAYHFSSSKIEDLGYLQGKGPRDYVEASFPYTPCQMGDMS